MHACMCLKIETGFDKQLHEMEQKIYGSVYKKANATDKPDEIEVGDTVAVFMPSWNRWVRGQLKEVSSDGEFFVWAIDYGVPVVSKSAGVIKLPAIYTKMNVNYPRVHIGGLINCVPAEGGYDFEADNMVSNETSVWSEKANEIVQKAIDCAIQMKFENPVEFQLMNRPGIHRFGQLAIQLKPDGTWTDLTKCLSNAFVAKITTNDWFATNIHQMQSIRQPEWKTNDETPLNVKMVVSKHIPRPSTTANGAPSASNQPIESNAVAENASVDSSVKTGNEATESKVNKKSNASKCFGPFQGRPQTRPYVNQYPTGMMNSNRGAGQMRRGGQFYSRGGLVNRCSTSRDRNYHHHGRMQAQMDQEYFESCFRKPTQPKTKLSSESSSGDSNDENQDDKQTVDNETKQEENPNKSNEGANEHDSPSNEVKNDATAVVTDTVPIAATPTTVATPTPSPEASSTPPASTTPQTQAAVATDVDVDKSTNTNDEQKIE